MRGGNTLAGTETKPPLLPTPGAVARARLVVAGLLVAYVAAYQVPDGFEQPAGVKIVAFCLLAVLFASAIAQMTGAVPASRLLYLAIDGAVAIALLGVFAFDPMEHLFFPAVAVIVEAALLLGLGTALVSWAAVALGYTLREVLAYSFLNVPSDPAGVVLRLATAFGVALVVGSLVEAGRATKAYSSEREETERLKEIDQMKTAFLAAVSHDLKNPLTAILGFSTTLERRLDRLPPDRVLEFLGHITRSARRLQKMVDDLLDMDRMERGILQPNLLPTDLPGLARGIIDEIDLAGHPITVNADDLKIEVDPPKVERIVENLITNAIKYTPAGTPIEVRIEPMEAGALIAIEDRGPGIPIELKKKIFEAFQRGPDAPNKAKGSGVGLSLVARFAELHGGRAWVEDRPGGGSSFRVYLPGDMSR